MPEVMLFELMSTDVLTIHGPKYTNKTERIEQLQSLSETQHITVSKFHGNGFNRGSPHNMYLNEFAKFYNYPVISFGDATWPSFVRHYIDRGHLERYPFTIEGYHLNNLGCRFAVEHMLGPFIVNTMTPRIEENITQNDMYGVDLHMFKLSRLSTELEHYTAWSDVVNNSLSTIIVNPSKNWSFEHTSHHSVGHYCYHTNKYNAVATFHVSLPQGCQIGAACHITLSSLFTWNDSYIGELAARIVACFILLFLHIS
jgi:hypothetical protein